MTADSRLNNFLAEYRSLEEQDLRFEYLIELAGRFRPAGSPIANRPFGAEHKVPGCESEVYIWAELLPSPNGERRFKFHFAVENPQGVSAKALAVILDENLSGCTAAEIQSADPAMVYDLFGRGLTMGKGQGLMGMIQMVRALAV